MTETVTVRRCSAHQHTDKSANEHTDKNINHSADKSTDKGTNPCIPNMCASVIALLTLCFDSHRAR